MEPILEETILFGAAIALVGWVLFLLFRRQQMHLQARMKRTEVFDHLIEKFTTSQEFIEFLKTDEGKKLIEDPLKQPTNPSKAVLRFLLAGVVFAALSYAYIAHSNELNSYIHSIPDPDINEVHKVMDFHAWGTLTMALAGGMFVMAAVTKLLAKKWDINGKQSH
jgi:hypothetical protein